MSKMKGALKIFTLLLSAASTKGLDPSQCITPLGMENGMIKDEHITASTSFDVKNVGPHQGRMRNELQGGAWCPLKPVTADLKEWIEIDLHEVHMITSTGIQGRFGNGQGVEYAEFYMIEYWRPCLNKWIRYHNRTGNEVMKGNFNTYLESKNELNPPIWASKIRFLPFSYISRTVCIRVEIYGCYWSEGISSYSMPQGDKRGSSWEFYDSTYDGNWDGEELRYGLGQLTDGEVAPDDFKVAFYTLMNQGWVGWKNDSRENKPIEINFEFDWIREFASLHIYCNNQFTKDVQVFAAAKIYFSIDGKYYKGAPITYDYIEDLIFENPRNISIKLYQRIGKFVKIELFFASRWILLSEVKFNSRVINLNFSAVENNEGYVLNDHMTTPGLSNEKKVDEVNTQGAVESYVGVIVGMLTVLFFIMIVAIIVVLMKQRRYKSSLRSSQIRSGCDKAVLHQEPSLGRFSASSDYAEVKESEYAIPLQSPPQNYRNAPSLINFLPKPPPGPPPSERYYAATQISDEGFMCAPSIPPMPSTVSSIGQPRYVFSTSKMNIGHNL